MQGFFIKRTPCAPLRICIVSFSVPYRWFSALISIRHLSFADFWLFSPIAANWTPPKGRSNLQAKRVMTVSQKNTSSEFLHRKWCHCFSTKPCTWWLIFVTSVLNFPPPLLSIEHRQWWLIWDGWKLHYLYNDRKMWIKANYLEN